MMDRTLAVKLDRNARLFEGSPGSSEEDLNKHVAAQLAWLGSWLVGRGSSLPEVRDRNVTAYRERQRVQREADAASMAPLRDVMQRRKPRTAANDGEPDDLPLGNRPAALVELVARKLLDNQLLVTRKGAIWLWDGKVWRPHSTGELYYQVEQVLRSELELLQGLPQDDETKARRHALKGQLDACLTFSRSVRSRLLSWAGLYGVDALLFDQAPRQINLEAGILHLDDGSLEPHTPSALHSRTAPAPFDPEATCPLWEAHILNLVGGDAELARVWQVALGAALDPQRLEHGFATAIGAGGCGKSTVFEVLQKYVLGAEYVVTLPRRLYLKRSTGSGHETELVRLIGARIAYVDDIPDGGIAVADLKENTSITRLAVRGMREDMREGAWEAKVFMLGNDALRHQDTSGGLDRRHRRLPVLAKPVPKESANAHLKAQLGAEAAGILQWLLRGWRMWVENGHITPQTHEVIQGVREAERVETDMATLFMEEWLMFEPEAVCTGRKLSEVIAEFVRIHSLSQQITERQIRVALRARGVEHKHTKAGKVWKGVKIAEATYGA